MLAILVDTALVCLGGVAGYVHASLIESWCHDRIWHARKRARKRSAQLPFVGTAIKKAWKSHRVVHHGMSFRQDLVTQFQSSGFPIGDWLRGVYISPDASDLVEMDKVNGPLPTRL